MFSVSSGKAAKNHGYFPPADKCQWTSHAETIFVLLIVPLNSSELAGGPADKTSGFDA